MSKKGRNKKKAAQRRAAAASTRTEVQQAKPLHEEKVIVRPPSDPPLRDEAPSDSPVVLPAAPPVPADLAASAQDPDEISVPPVTELTPSTHAVVAHAHERDFFERPSQKLLAEIAAARDEAAEDFEDEPPTHAKTRMTPAAIARRQQYRTYVKAAMGICAGVLALGLVRTAIHRAGGDERAASADVTATSHEHTTAAAAPQPPQAAPVAQAAQGAQVAQVAQAAIPPAPAAEPQPAQPAIAQAAPAAPPPVADPAPAANAPSVAPATPAAAAAPAAAPAADTDDTTKSALDEKKESRRQLEKGKTSLAIAAGERSVAADPSDGEAWLILGAAYQQAGKLADARRCYSSCLKEGKKGSPFGECRAMLR